ncbi:small EDRK-rich factor 2 [Micractinium conductrix]|uniref:Small EDRK-rich factor 2 n=1 Tax=Micractinium conductrix TaxID=554055 RepID=A0A2P6VPF8_9CHLO|nr:small EDRK-rich factor 2 [Micractinium conductrix]|eukprot:PSC75976.1 small EDRK-rich factor 2 [Micractinium conductrix]
MTRGNQREIDRMRAQKRAQKNLTSKDKQSADGLTPAQRKERDAKALQEKAAKKAAEKSGGK